MKFLKHKYIKMKNNRGGPKDSKNSQNRAKPTSGKQPESKPETKPKDFSIAILVVKKLLID